MQDERWRPVVGHEGYYEVSDRGRVRSLGRMANRGRAGWRWMDGRILQLNESNGRYMVALSVKGEVRQSTVGPLVLEAFVGPRPPGMECCHWDDHPKNDVLENLRWDTTVANMADKLRNGHDWHATKTHCPQGHGLFPPNLFGNAETGRECVACSNTRSWGRRNGISADDPRWTAEADHRYQAILARLPGGRNRSKTACKRGHELRAPNLVQLASGSRSCLACGRTSSWARYHGIPMGSAQWRADADQRYAVIMNGLPVTP